MDDELKEIRKRKMEKLKKKLMTVRKMDINDENFKKEVLEKSKEIPVVVDFWAAWCMPCQILKPVLEKLEKEYGGKFVLAKVNVDNARKTSVEYGIMSIPSVKMFRSGEVVDEFSGALPEAQVREWLDSNLGK